MTGEQRVMPDGVRRALLAAAVVLAAVAAVGNFGHVYDFAHGANDGGQQRGQAAIVALLPDVLLVLSIVKLRYAPRSLLAWVGLVLSVTFVGWAAVATADDTVTARAVAVWPLVVAVIAAGLLEARGPQVAAPARRKPRASRSGGPVSSGQPAAVGPGEAVTQRPSQPARPTTQPAVTDLAAVDVPELAATAPAGGETDRERSARLRAAREACVAEVARHRRAGRTVTITAIKTAYGAGDTWAKAVSGDANKPARPVAVSR